MTINNLMNIDNLASLKRALEQKLAQERASNFGSVKPEWIHYANEYHWDESQQVPRMRDLVSSGFVPGKSRILDVAAGYGQYFCYASKFGYDCYGLEPDKWKVDFVKKKLDLFDMQNLSEHIVEGFGERIPFDDSFFDCVTTFQTLEHVQKPKKVISEMLRVTKPGGGVHIRCPDYRSTFEAHYQLPWLPLFPRYFAKLYLRILKRPAEGLASICYVTKGRIIKWLHKCAKESGCKIVVMDNDKIAFSNALQKRGLPDAPGGFELWRVLNWARYIFRKEISVNLFVRIVEKQRNGNI